MFLNFLFFILANMGIQSSMNRTIPLGACSLLVPQTPSNYKEESLGDGPKMLSRSLELKVSFLILLDTYTLLIIYLQLCKYMIPD